MGLLHDGPHRRRRRAWPPAADPWRAAAHDSCHRLLGLIIALLATGAGPALAGWDEGVAAFKARNYTQAVGEFQQLVESAPDGYRGHYMLGLSLEQLGRKEEALHHLRRAYDLNPNDLPVKLALGRSYRNVRRFGDAAQLLGGVDASALSGSQKAAFHQIRGESRLMNGDEDGAFRDYQEMAKLKGSDAKAQLNYGKIAYRVDRLDISIAALAKAHQLDPRDAETQRVYSQALIKKGRISRDKPSKRQAYLTAAGVAKKLATADPSFDNLLLQLSAEVGAGLYDEAVQTGKKAVTKGDDWLAPFYLGQAYTSSGRYENAEEPLRQALGLARDPAEKRTVWKQLGFSYEKQKEYAQAIEAYENAGDQGAVARVQKNKETAEYNAKVEDENRRIEEMREEAKRLEEELKKLEGGGGGR